MESNIVRALIGLVLAGLLVLQARGTQGKPNRRRALFCAAAAFAVFAVVNLLLGARATFDTPSLLLAGAGGVLLLAALVFFLRSWQAGELKTMAGDFQTTMREFGEQRERETRDRK